MQKTTEWLNEEHIPATGGELLAALEKAGALPCRTSDPGEYMKDLLAPVECHAHTIDRLSNLFAYGEAKDQISPSPRAVVHMMTAELTGPAPVTAHAASLLAEAYLKMGNLAAAEITALAAVKAGGRAPVALKVAAAAALDRGKTGAARELASSLEDTSAEVAILLGRIAFDEGSDSEAFAHFQTAAENDPSRTTAILFMAMIALRNRQLGTALELAVLAASARDENSAKAWLLASDALRLAGNRSEAGEALAQAANSAGDDETLKTEIAARKKLLVPN